jgi:hypothetical protein
MKNFMQEDLSDGLPVVNSDAGAPASKLSLVFGQTVQGCRVARFGLQRVI